MRTSSRPLRLAARPALRPAFLAPLKTLAALVALAGPGLAACHDTAFQKTEVLEASTSPAALTGQDDPAVVAPDAVTTPALGAKSPLVIVSVFSDFQCPACRQIPELLEPLLTQYGGAIQIQFHQFPLEAIHPHAKAAAIAALAAHRQGHYKCFGTELYRTQEAWAELKDGPFEAQLATIAATCHLDVTRFQRDRADGRIADKVDRDLELARDLELRGTPTILIDGLEMERRWKAGIHETMRPNALIRRGLRDSELLLRLGNDRAAIPAQRIEGNMGGDAEKTERLLN